VVATILKDDYGSNKLNWDEVALYFDHSNFYLPDLKALDILLALYRASSGQ